MYQNERGEKNVASTKRVSEDEDASREGIQEIYHWIVSRIST